MKKVAVVLVMALGLIGCTTDEVPTEVVEVQSIIEVMEGNTLYERVDDEGGLRIRRGQRISQIFESNSAYCFLEIDFNTNEFILITSDENTYSYRITTVIGNTYQYAFRSDDNGDSLRLTVYSYDEVEEEHTFLNEFEYLKTTKEFTICN
tara:strand:- start:268 stop:717 length:450 start_codon:yes stop_codon:yes gene_type:complete